MTPPETLLELVYLWLHRVECVNSKSIEAWHQWRRGKMADSEFARALRLLTIQLRGNTERLETLAATLSQQGESTNPDGPDTMKKTN